MELLSPEGLRIDGRRPNELRKVECKTSVFHQADGSAHVQIGNTKVLAAVYGPREARHRAQVLHDRAMINVEYGMATFSTSERRERRKRDKRLLEMASQIKKTFEPVICTHLFPRSQIDIYLQIIQADGGNLQACINAATLALVDAGIPMIDYVCACTVGFVDSSPLLDLNYVEESMDCPELTVALLPKSNKVTLVQLESRLHLDRLEEVLDVASQGCLRLYDVLDGTIRSSTKDLATKVLQ